MVNSLMSSRLCFDNTFLSPAGVRDVPHDVVLGEVQPVPPHHLVAVTVGAVGVSNHLGSPRGSAGEVDLHD